MSDELSLGDSDTSFSGFSDENSAPGTPKMGKKVRSTVRLMTGKKSSDDLQMSSDKGKGKSLDKNKSSDKSSDKPSNKSSDKPSDKGKSLKITKRKTGTVVTPPTFDFSKMGKDDIESLRTALGITTPQTQQYEYDNQYEYDDLEYHSPLESLENLPNVTVEIDRQDISDSEVYEETTPQISSRALSKNISSAFCVEERDNSPSDGFWQLPKLRAPLKGEAIPESLAKLINTSCTVSCDVEQFKKYKTPENCDKMAAPLVNQEVWKIMDRRGHATDKSMVEIQNLLASGMVPLIKLASELKDQMKENENIKTLLSDAMTVFGQVQYNLSLRRRFTIRPYLNRKYSGLCNSSFPITSMLFGDQIDKEIKAADASKYLGVKNAQGYQSGYQNSQPRFNNRGRGTGKYYFDRQQGRYAPYPCDQRGRGGHFNLRGRGRARPSATATMANPNGR